MGADKLRFTGTCLISFSIISLAAAFSYIGYEAAQIRREVPVILERVDHINQNISRIIRETEIVRKDVPAILDRTEKLMTDAYNLSRKAGEEAGKGAVKGAVKSTIGLPMDTTKKILKTPTGVLRKTKNTKGKSDTKNQD